MATNDQTTITDGIDVNDIAAELDNLAGTCRAVARDGEAENSDTVRALWTVAVALDALNAKLCDIGWRLEHPERPAA